MLCHRRPGAGRRHIARIVPNFPSRAEPPPRRAITTAVGTVPPSGSADQAGLSMVAGNHSSTTTHPHSASRPGRTTRPWKPAPVRRHSRSRPATRPGSSPTQQCLTPDGPGDGPGGGLAGSTSCSAASGGSASCVTRWDIRRLFQGVRQHIWTRVGARSLGPRTGAQEEGAGSAGARPGTTLVAPSPVMLQVPSCRQPGWVHSTWSRGAAVSRPLNE
jgi:hypothetical protein